MPIFENYQSIKTDRLSSWIRRVPLVLSTGFLLCALPAQAQYEFQVVHPPGASFSQAFGINNAGKVVGNAGDDDEDFRFVYDMKTAEYTVIADGFSVLEINNPGEMVGSVGDDCTIRDKKGEVTTFYPPAFDDGFLDCNARGINAKGLVTGFEIDPITNDWLGFVYDPKKGTYEEFLPSPLQNIANGINAQGEVAGNVGVVDEDALFPGSIAGSYGYVRQPDGSVKYFLIDDSQSLPGRTRARGISESGLVTGWYNDSVEGTQRSFVIELSKGDEFESVVLEDDEMVYQSPCNPDRPPLLGDGYDLLYTNVSTSQVRNDGVVVGSCVDSYFDENTNDEIRYFWGFIATPVE